MNHRPAILTVAPLAQHYYDEVTTFPTASGLAAEIVACHRAGAAVCHLHVIDERGYPTFDSSFFEEVLARVRDESDIVMQSSTGGVSSLSRDERSVSVGVPGMEMASLNMGSCDLGETAYVNTPADVRYWAEKMQRHGVKPEMVFFEPGMFGMLDRLRAEGLADGPPVVNLALGFVGALPASPENLLFMHSKLPAGAEWSVTAHHARDLSLQAVALSLGGNLRVGFEDSVYRTPRHRAADNAELVAAARDLAALLGRDLATPAEARERYGMAPLAEINRTLQTQFSA